MASYKGTVSTPHAPAEVWSYLADLRSVADWDPSVADARLLSGEAASVGSRYEVEVSFLGRTIVLPYVTIAAEAPSLVVFSAETDSVSVRDEARITAVADGGSTVVWDADLSLAGPRRVLDLPLRAAFARIGRHAERGLAERLIEPTLRPSGGLSRA